MTDTPTPPTVDAADPSAASNAGAPDASTPQRSGAPVVVGQGQTPAEVAALLGHPGDWPTLVLANMQTLLGNLPAAELAKLTTEAEALAHGVERWRAGVELSWPAQWGPRPSEAPAQDALESRQEAPQTADDKRRALEAQLAELSAQLAAMDKPAD